MDTNRQREELLEVIYELKDDGFSSLLFESLAAVATDAAGPDSPDPETWEEIVHGWDENDPEHQEWADWWTEAMEEQILNASPGQISFYHSELDADRDFRDLGPGPMGQRARSRIRRDAAADRACDSWRGERDW